MLGIEHAITTLELLKLDRQPEHLAIVGDNHVAVKLAGIMNGLISKVTQVVPGDRILPRCDDEVRTMVQEDMSRLGVRILSSRKVERIENCLNLFVSGDNQPIEVDTVVSITSRMPNLDDLGLEAIGVKVDETGITIDEHRCTTQPNIFAIGDCTHRPHWTPVAIAAGRAFAEIEFGDRTQVVDYQNIPCVVASKPEAATVGLTEAQAREQFGESIHCYANKFQPLFNLMSGSAQKTLLKLVVDADSDRLLGAQMVGEYAAEIIQMLALAMKAGVTKAHFDSTIGIHPSVGEEFFTLH